MLRLTLRSLLRLLPLLFLCSRVLGGIHRKDLFDAPFRRFIPLTRRFEFVVATFDAYKHGRTRHSTFVGVVAKVDHVPFELDWELNRSKALFDEEFLHVVLHRASYGVHRVKRVGKLVAKKFDVEVVLLW